MWKVSATAKAKGQQLKIPFHFLNNLLKISSYVNIRIKSYPTSIEIKLKLIRRFMVDGNSKTRTLLYEATKVKSARFVQRIRVQFRQTEISSAL